jgi:hypothetical protein
MLNVIVHLALLFGAPIGAFFLSRAWPRFSKSVSTRLAWTFSLSIATALLATLSQYSFKAYAWEATTLALAWCSGCCVLSLAFLKTSGNISAACLGILKRIGSLLALGLVLYGSLHAWNRRANWSLPVTEAALGDDLVLRRDEGGWLGQNWEGVTIVQRFPKLPFIERTLYAIRMGDTEDCDETQVRVTPDPVEREVLVQCGTNHPYTWAHVKMP